MNTSVVVKKIEGPSHRPIFGGSAKVQQDPQNEVKKHRNTWPIIKKIGGYLLIAALAIFLSQVAINWYNGRLVACTTPKGYDSFVGEAMNPTDGNIYVIRSIYPNGNGTSGKSLLLVFSLCGSPDDGFETRNNYEVTTKDGSKIVLNTVVFQKEAKASVPLAMEPQLAK